MDELKRIKDILEAALLVAGEPVAVPQLARMFDPPLDGGVVINLLTEIQRGMDRQAGGIGAGRVRLAVPGHAVDSTSPRSALARKSRRAIRAR